MRCYPLQVMGQMEPIPAAFGRKVGYTRNRLPGDSTVTNNHPHSHQCAIWIPDYKRKPESPKAMWRICKLHSEVIPGIELRTFCGATNKPP